MDDVAEHLRPNELFARVPAPLLEGIAARLVVERLESGSVLFREGDRGEAACLVVSGRLGIEAGGTTILVREAGERVGELALIDDEPRRAAAVALTEPEVRRDAILVAAADFGHGRAQEDDHTLAVARAREEGK